MNLNIDIVGACNLHCPSCPMGRGDIAPSGQQMSKGLLVQILTKAKREFRIHRIQLYDVTEPTLHRDLPAMIRAARQFGPVEISTNGSVRNVDWEAIVTAGPAQITISLSGDIPDTHARGHVGSNLRDVHVAMAAIDAACRYQGVRMRRQVLYHRYPYNLAEEATAKKRARRLGFSFAGLWASTLRPYGQENIAGCVLSPSDAAWIGPRYPGKNCLVLERNININVNGEVTQCAGFGHVLAAFLGVPFYEIQLLRRTDPFCRECSSSGMLRYVCRDPHLDSWNARQVGDCWQYRWDRWRHWLFYVREKLMR